MVDLPTDAGSPQASAGAERAGPASLESPPGAPAAGQGGSAAAAGVRPGLSPLSVGVVVWLASELMFFSGLFAAYFTLRSTTRPWPPDGVELATGRTAIATAVLVASSFVMHRAVRSASAGERQAAVRWLALTAFMGLVFLGNQAWEYARAPFSMSSHAYGSMFYLMTGFHGLHVIGGIVFMGAVIWLISGTGSRVAAHPAVEVCGYYWHFVDVVWVAMFATIYLVR